MIQFIGMVVLGIIIYELYHKGVIKAFAGQIIMWVVIIALILYAFTHGIKPHTPISYKDNPQTQTTK